MDFTKELNTNQYLAVSTPAQYARVVAGAGSGKTRVLTYRIAYLLECENVNPWEILAITFTNKVAKEMKDRITNLIPTNTKELTIKTFHSFCAMFLRREIVNLDFPTTFTILDEEDQLKMIKDIAKSLNYKKSDPIVKAAINFISNAKLKEQLPYDIELPADASDEKKDCLEIYKLYEMQKDRIYALDFDDLILKTNQILTQFPQIRFKWQNKFLHILVDEFQDTNDVEFKLLTLLMDNATSLYVVGDPDQTIYTWRGANQDIILKFKERYPLAEDIVLDRNYRSTQNILNAANKLISKNRLRIHKNLYTENNTGDEIVVKSCASERNEADHVCRTIRNLKYAENRPYKDIVILYRSNYVTKDFEHALTAANIPYRIYGGLKFYQRREIKDVLSYFRLVNNKKDDVAFERIINVPKRNIGETTLNIIKEEALDHNLSIYEYLSIVNPEESNLSKKHIQTLKSLIYRLDKAREDVETNDEMYAKFLEDLITDIGYYDYLKQEEDYDDRILNIKTLFEDIRYYIKGNPESTFAEYLQNISLISAQDEVSNGDYVTLMTVHTAKGLEFPVVFLVRLNESVFPSARAINSLTASNKALEEERRLCYVAITRAKEKLYISYSNNYSYQAGTDLSMSRFISDAGLVKQEAAFRPVGRTFESFVRKEIIKEARILTPAPSIKEVISKLSNDVDGWNVGDIAIHKKFGEGKVVEVEGDGVIVVLFPEHGKKTLMGNHPALTKGGHKA